MTIEEHPDSPGLHFPATFTRLLTSRFSEGHPTAKFGVYSDDPFASQRGRVLDPFTQDALNALRDGAEAEYWRIEDVEGRSRVRFATPIRMESGCVACHNRPEWRLRKTDWQVGDVRGVWEVSLDVPRTYLNSRSENRVLITLNIVACVLGGLLVFPSVRREIARRTYFESLSLDLGTQAETDPLSGLANRRAFDAMMDKVFAPGRRGEYGLIVVDIDHFKRVNDTYGHTVGDQVIVQVASVIKMNIRPQDFVARIGGEEFAIVAPDARPEDLRSIAQRVRVAIEKAPIEYDGAFVRVTASVGATLLNGNDDRQSFFRRADRQLYKAKDKGRNQVEVAV